LQIIGSHDVADWIAGLYFGRTSGEDGSKSIQFNGLGLQSITGPAGGVVNQTMAIFAQSTWHLTDRLNLTTGLRFTKDDREVTYISQQIERLPFQPFRCLLTISTTTGSAVPNPCALQRNKSYQEPTWNLTLDYKLTDDSLLYAATRRGYRAGGFPGRGQTEVTTRPFAPEIVDDLEFGYKIDTDLAGMPLRVNTAVFYQDYQDIQRNVTLNDGVTLQNTVANAAAGTVKGGEIELTLLPFDSLELTGFLTFVDASYDEWDDQTSAGVPVNRAVNDFQGIPETSGSLTARYTLPLSSSIGEVSIAATAYYQSETALYVDNKIDNTGNECLGGRQDSYKLYNARVDWTDFLGQAGLNLAAWGKNLNNEEYFSSGLCLYNAAGISMAYPAEPRTFGVSASYKF
jgi:iron complex outermembrane receptor protein